MFSLTKERRAPDVDLPKVDLKKIELPSFDMPDLDIGKAALGAATAVGLVRRRRSRRPMVVGGVIAMVIAGLAYLNRTMIMERKAQAAAWLSDRMESMRTEEDTDEPVAFTAAETAPIETPETVVEAGPDAPDYPEGFGIQAEMAAPSENGVKSTAAGRRA